MIAVDFPHSQCSSYRVAILRFWKRRSTGPEPELHRQMIMRSERVSARISPTRPENSNTLPSPPLSCFYVVISSPVVFTNVRKIVVMLAPRMYLICQMGVQNPTGSTHGLSGPLMDSSFPRPRSSIRARVYGPGSESVESRHGFSYALGVRHGIL